MKRTILTAAVAALVTLSVALAAAAQTDLLSGLLGPVVVTIEQSVPVEVSLATELDDGTVVTSTVPLTVGVSLAITIDGEQVVAVAPAEAGEAEVAVEEPAVEEEDGQLVDGSGLSYELDVPEGFEFAQLLVTEMFGNTQIIGEITNNTDDEPTFPIVVVSLYDDDGALLGTANGMVSVDLKPGATSPFSALATVQLKAVASYKIQFNP